MSRIIFMLVLLVVGFVLLKSWQRRQKIRQSLQKKTGQASINTRMIPCNHCGLYVPEHEAISQGGKYFCTRAHQIQHSTQS